MKKNAIARKVKFFISATIALLSLPTFALEAQCFPNYYIVAIAASTGDNNGRFRIYLSEQPGGDVATSIYSDKDTTNVAARNAYTIAINAMNFQFPVKIEMSNCANGSFYSITQSLKPTGAN